MPDPSIHAFDAAALVALAADAERTQAEVFETMAWFANLQACGFPSPPEAIWLWLEQAEAGAFALPLMPAPGGMGLCGLSNYYSSLYGPVGDPYALPASAWRKLGQWLRRHPRGSMVRLQPLAREGFFGAMSQGLAAAGYWVSSYFCFGNWYLPTRGLSAAAHFAALPSALRHSVERGRRRLRREGDWLLQIHTAADPALDLAIAAFEAVYRQSWKQQEPCPGFMPGLIRTAAEQGWLRLGILTLKDRPIAAQVWLVKAGKASIYKLAYVEGFERHSPGSVLTAALMQQVIDADRVHEVDYLTGDEAYKRDWMSHRRERVGIVAFDPTSLAGLVGAARHFGGHWWRRFATRSLRSAGSSAPAGPATPS